MIKDILKTIMFAVVGVITIFPHNVTVYAEELSTVDRNKMLGAVASEWYSTNIREWLNSDKLIVDYTALPPSYKSEAGFLSTNNFTEEEKNSIAVTKHGAGWQYSIGNRSLTNYYSLRSLTHNDYLYNDKVFILHYTDLVNYIEKNKVAEENRTKYYSNYLQYTTNKKSSYDFLVNSGYYNSSYYGTNPMYSSMLNSLQGNSPQNIAPALSLKPDTILSNGVVAKDLKIGSTVTFGKYNGEPIEWKVINVSNSGYPLLWSNKIITIKEYDVKGDINPNKSNYINFPNFDVDIASGTGEAKSWETGKVIDSTTKITIENESVLTTPTNDTYITLKINATDTKYSIKKITLPNGEVVEGDKAEWTLTKNGEYDIIAENSNGVMTVRHIVTKSINTPAEVTITTDKTGNSKWTNKPVNVTISATNNGVYETTAKGNKEMGYAGSNAGTYPNWMPLGGKRIRVVGTLKNVMSDADALTVDMNACIRVRMSMNYYTNSSVGVTYPIMKEISLKELKEKGEIQIDETIVIQSNSYDSVRPYVTFMDGATAYSKKPYSYWMSDFHFEILDKDDLKIEEITMPDGSVVKSDSATYTVFKNGIHSFSVKDNREKTTTKDIELAIDMINPTMDITLSETKFTKDVVLTLKAFDDLSGIKSIKFPNGEFRENLVDGSGLTTTYNVLENGNYTFEVQDFAGNKYIKTVNISNIDRVAPTIEIVSESNEWSNSSVTLNVSASDTQSGVKQITLPNGNIINSKTATFITKDNGVYTFKSSDNLGNEGSESITVGKIDKVPPVIIATKEIASDKLSGFININVKDTLSGVDYFILPDGTEIKGQETHKYPINNNGIYLFTSYDNVGNTGTFSVEVNELNTNINPSGISKIEYKLTGATTQDWTNYTSAFYIKNEGITYITARSYDNVGNISLEETSQVKIDKTKPINNGIKIELKDIISN